MDSEEHPRQQQNRVHNALITPTTKNLKIKKLKKLSILKGKSRITRSHCTCNLQQNRNTQANSTRRERQENKTQKKYQELPSQTVSHKDPLGLNTTNNLIFSPQMRKSRTSLQNSNISNLSTGNEDGTYGRKHTCKARRVIL